MNKKLNTVLIIKDVIKTILDEKEIEVDSISENLELHADLGINSLDLARLVAHLELQLHKDPFKESLAITSIKTVADLINAYELSHEQQKFNDLEELKKFKNKLIPNEIV